MNQDEALMLMFAIKTEWPKFEVTDDRAALWSKTLEHLSLDDAMEALALVLRNGGTYGEPRPSDILKQISTEATSETLVDAAWAEVLREVKRVGLRPMGYWAGGVHYDAPVRTFSSPLIAMAVENVGWQEICTSEKPGIQRASFKDALEALMARHQRDIHSFGTQHAMEMLEARASRVENAGSSMTSIGDMNLGAISSRTERHGRPEGDRDPGPVPALAEGRVAGRDELVGRDGPDLDMRRDGSGLRPLRDAVPQRARFAPERSKGVK